jgi:transposase
MKRRRKYDQQFKDEAVRLLIRGDKTLKEVAENLGVERSCLARWRNRYLKGATGEGEKPMEAGQNASELEKENRRLRKDLAEAVQHREILKKAVGIFSRDPDRYTGS